MYRTVFVLVATILLLAGCQSAQGPGTGGGGDDAPTASFTTSVSSGSAPLTVTFDATGSTDDGTLVSHAWSFGDGGTGSGATAMHTFAAAGTFLVTLTVTDDGGQTDVATGQILVADATGNVPPAASFAVTPTSGEAPLAVTVDASGSTDSDGAIASYAWDFGDGGTATGSTAGHTFAAAGTFAITLTVTDNSGATATATETVEVTGTSSTPSDKALVASGVTAGAGKEQLEEETATIGLEAVVLASDLATGGASLVTTGTLTQSAGGTWTYAATPADRLVVAFSSGTSMDFFITELNGDFTAPSTESFLRRDHIFRFRVVIAGQVDLSVDLATVSGNIQNTVAGSFTANGIVYTVDLATVGTYSFDVDSVTHEYADQTTGTVTATGLSLSVNESITYKLVGGAEQSSRSIENSWTVGADSYALTGGFIRRAFYETKPSELSYWRAEGTLTKNGVAIGGIGSTVDAVEITIFLDAAGDRTILETWKLP